MATVYGLLAAGSQRLLTASESPRLDAELLLAYAAGITRSNLLASAREEITPQIEERFCVLLERRAAHEPLAYIIGVKEFWGLEFEVRPQVLIPRPETELLVEKSLEMLAPKPGFLRIADMGTGSGCIAAALGWELVKAGRSFGMIAVDKSPAAAEVAKRNIARHALGDFINICVSDWFKAVGAQHCGFDLIVSNPPYVANGEKELPADVLYEPAPALFAGEEGLEEIFFLIEEAGAYLKVGGVFLSEFGAGQKVAIEQRLVYLTNEGRHWHSRVSFWRDLAGHDRALGLHKGG